MRTYLLRATALLVLISGVFALPTLSESRGRNTADGGNSRFAQLDGIKIHYLTYGKGGPAVVFIHGWSCDSTAWRYQTEALSSSFRTIAIDLPGHGQSDKPHIDYTMDLYARAIASVLDEAGVKRAFLVGHSNGTPVVRQFYRKYPDRTLGLVVADGALHSFFKDKSEAEKFLQPMRGDGYQDYASKFIDGMVAPVHDPQLRPQIKAMMLATPQYVAVSEFEAAADPAIWGDDKINIPVLVILAKQPYWSGEYEQYVRNLIPNIDYRMWEGVSHFLMMDRAKEFNEAVIGFVNKNARNLN